MQHPSNHLIESGRVFGTERIDDPTHRTGRDGKTPWLVVGGWVTNPPWKICASQIGSWNPKVRGENSKKYVQNHHLDGVLTTLPAISLLKNGLWLMTFVTSSHYCHLKWDDDYDSLICGARKLSKTNIWKNTKVFELSRWTKQLTCFFV